MRVKKEEEEEEYTVPKSSLRKRVQYRREELKSAGAE